MSATESTPAELLGVDPAALPLIRSWANDVGGLDQATAAALIAVPPVRTGLAVPSGATTLSIPVTGDLEQLSVVAWFRSGDRRDLGVGLTLVGNRWTATLPASSSGLRMLSVTLAESTDYATRHQHKIGEGVTDVAVLSGRVEPRGAVFRGRRPAPGRRGTWAGWGSDTAQVAAATDRLTIAYSLTGELVVVRAASGPVVQIPVLVDPATAARAVGGVLELASSGASPLRLHVVGTLPRFPTTGASFVVADVGALADQLDAREPGTGSVAELWVWAPDRASADLARVLALPPYDRLTVALRSQREAGLRSDPLAVGAQSLLTFSALLAMVVALLALVLLVLAERRDESAELYAWESDGVAPSTLRLSLFVRALAVVAVALPAGLLTGLVLSRVTTTLVALTAVGTTPRPPLVLSVGPLWVSGVLGVGLVVAILASGGVALGALRERLPMRPEQDLR